MTSTTTQTDSPGEPTAETQEPAGFATDRSPLTDTGTQHPRLIEEHLGVGPYGESELEATDELGRRWYHLRPQPRRRYDLIGFNYSWWLIWLFLMLIIFMPWGRY
jgi:hypothetical protein